MLYKCLIVDDEELARELIETHLSQLDDFEIIASCSSAIEAHKILQTEVIDLLFLDIEMPVLKGTDFLKTITKKPKVIFTTAYRDYAIEGFDLNAVDYLLKPIVFERFFQSIEKFLTVAKTPIQHSIKDTSENLHIYVQSNKKNIKISLNDIQYIESIKDYIRIHLINSTIILKHGITAFESKLDSRFIRAHRSYIVNKHKVTAFTKNDIEIGVIEIPIGEHYKTNVLDNI
jgi:DNA-binding LytR/AlgR family response regulator